MLLTSMATVEDFAFSNGELPRNQALTFSVDGSDVKKGVGAVDILLLHHRIRRDRAKACHEVAECGTHHADIGILDLLGETCRDRRSELVDLDDVGHQPHMRAQVHRVAEADDGHDQAEDTNNAPCGCGLHICAVALVPFLARGKIRIIRGAVRCHLFFPCLDYGLSLRSGGGFGPL